MSKKNKLKITGLTSGGKKFHPSDWAERISGSMSQYSQKKKKIIYSPLIRPSQEDGNKCIIIDEQLQQDNPSFYTHVINFAENNDLQIDVLSEELNAPENTKPDQDN